MRHFTPLIFLLALLSLALSHNWITRPHTYNTRYGTGSCSGAECVNACPEILNDADMLNTYKKPFVTWQRGQRVKVAWAKNNHHGGMVRFSIVPVPAMHDKMAHENFAFEYGCWEDGLYNCKDAGDACGTDTSNEAYRRDMVVPPIYDDGIYIFSTVWYGGLHYRKEHGQFSDFYSCSFIRIKGGVSAGSSFTPQWIPGTGPDIQNGLCLTASVTVGACSDECRNSRSVWGWPSDFWGGRPPAITRAMVQALMNKHTSAKMQIEGKVKANVVCPATCGTCGGSNCNDQKGGGENCCSGSIESARKSCDIYKPPCVRNGLPGMDRPLYRKPHKRPIPPGPGPAGITNGGDSQAGEKSKDVSAGKRKSKGGRKKRKRPSKKRKRPSKKRKRPSKKRKTPSGKRKTPSGKPPSSPKESVDAICRGGVCCPAICGSCGGSGCSSRKGGGEACCGSAIKRSGRKCGNFPPPCIGNLPSGGGGGGKRQPEKREEPRNCEGKICCADSCQSCGGSSCHRLRGGGGNCCTSVIARSGRRCDRDPAPCVKA